jgi:quinoprotein glucose dehydrogenase
MRTHIIITLVFASLATACGKSGSSGDLSNAPAAVVLEHGGETELESRSNRSSQFAGDDWPFYHGDPGGTHYSTLQQINLQTVSGLEVAWTYETGDAFGQGRSQSDMQSNPLIIGGRMFLVSPKGRLICLDPASGAELWAYDPSGDVPVKTKQRSRGVSYWKGGDDERVFFTFRKDLIAVDARTGQPVESFGVNGRVDMREGLGREARSLSVSNVSPGVVYKDLLILGSTGNTPGHVRAYDVKSGAIRWIFHTIPQPGEYGLETWPDGAWKTAMGANVWAGMTIDSDRGIIFLPTASAGMGDKDFYGADRHGDNLFGTSIVALNADTGDRIWHFQFVRHDLWDRDPPAQPTLVTVRRGDAEVPAVVQPTKAGLLFVFHRETGEPLFPVEDRKVFASRVPGEAAAPVQRFPLKPAPFARQHLTKENLTRRTPEAAKAVADAFANLSSRGPFDPPSLEGTIIFPGLDGGAEWGGAAYDPETSLIYVNSNEMAWILKLRPRPQIIDARDGRSLYLNNCMSCHGEKLEGSPPEFPPLLDVTERLSANEIYSMIAAGSGRMPAFNHLSQQDIKEVVSYLQTGDLSNAPAKTDETGSGLPRSGRSDFIFDGYKKFLDPDGYPAVSPPWGTLSAINVDTGGYAWSVPFGAYPELAAQGIENTGSENYGGGVVTKGGLFIIASTVFDNKIRAFNKLTGELLWEDTLPAAGNATPSTYMAKGRQFVAIAAGGGKNPDALPGGKIVAYALPVEGPK